MKNNSGHKRASIQFPFQSYPRMTHQPRGIMALPISPTPQKSEMLLSRRKKTEPNDILELCRQNAELCAENELMKRYLNSLMMPREYHWIIEDFNRCWTCSFGSNDHGEYAFILTLAKRMEKIEGGSDLVIKATFRMHHPFAKSYDKSKPEPMVFNDKAMRSRGFLNFARVDQIDSHIDPGTNGGKRRIARLLKLSVVLQKAHPMLI